MLRFALLLLPCCAAAHLSPFTRLGYGGYFQALPEGYSLPLHRMHTHQQPFSQS